MPMQDLGLISTAALCGLARASLAQPERSAQLPANATELLGVYVLDALAGGDAGDGEAT